MFYRRKLLLATLQSFGGRLGKTQLQKILLLITQKQERPDYHFVPYKYGCYSFQASADMNTMEKYRQLAVSQKGIEKMDVADYVVTLKDSDKDILKQVVTDHLGQTYRHLIHYTYTKYPYYAIHSEIAGRYLNIPELKKVEDARPLNTRTVLYTIGYEGIPLETYLNKLIREDVKVLVDVRNNPKSMKYGFTKNQLMHAAESVGIRYLHFPDVGIFSAQRQNLNCQADYDRLFESYREKILPQTTLTQERILEILKKEQRIALTCFEANICECHRKHLADAITRLPGWSFELIHI